MKRLGIPVGLGAFALGLFGCSSPSDPSAAASADERVVVAPGKADNYYSNVASEYKVTGQVDITFKTQADAGDPTLRQDKIDRRMTAVALFLTTFMTNKLEGFFKNTSYGGFSAMARNHTIEPTDIEEVDATHLRVKFEIDVAGPANLVQALPVTEDGEEGLIQFDLAMPAGFEASPNEVPRGEIRNFNPETYSGDVEKVRCTITKEQASANAYPHVAEMLDDGMLDITLFYGHDYNASRSDLQEAERSFDFLAYDLGFQPPVDTFADLKADSGPFTRTMSANDKEAKVEVRIYHSEMFVGARKAGHDTAISELRDRDVFFYNGHAGPFYGLYLSDDKPNDVTYQELATVELSSKQQIFVAQGCQTYSQYADMLYANPAKSEANLDVFTTVNYSYGMGTQDLLKTFLYIEFDRFRPTTFAEMVEQLNAHYINSSHEVFYGVHGIDDNPRIHPFANKERFGAPCSNDEDCGDFTGNLCVAPTAGAQKVCAMLALEGATCPSGNKSMPVAMGEYISFYACVP